MSTRPDKYAAMRVKPFPDPQVIGTLGSGTKIVPVVRFASGREYAVSPSGAYICIKK